MKNYLLPVIFALVTAFPSYGECAPLFPEFDVETLLEEAMDQISEEIKSEILRVKSLSFRKC